MSPTKGWKNNKNKMINTRKFNKGLVTTLTGLLVLASVFSPLANTANAAAAFNGGTQPYDLFAIANATDNPNCNTCWSSSNITAEIGDTVAMRVFFNNSSSETANDTRVRITASLSGNGTSISTTGKVWANNAATESDSATVTITGDEATNLKFLSTKVYDKDSNSASFSGSQDDVLELGCICVGNLAPGLIDAGFVVVNFLIEGDEDDDNNNSDLSVTTENAEDIEDDRAELVCDVETADADADVWFEWGEDDDDLDEDTNKVNVDSSDTDTVRKTITGLDEDTKYFFRCVAEDDDGDDDEGSIKNFTTDENGGGSSNANEPDVVTRPATGIDSASATLRCEVDPNGDDTDAWFEWGTSSSNLNRTTSKQDVGDGTNDVFCSANISGLSANTTYYFRALAENGEGDDRGSVLNFRTGSPIVNVVTRFVDVFREVEVASEPEVEALIITLNANTGDVNRREIDYTVSYDNRTGLTLTDVVLTVPMPRELDFISSDPRESLNRDGELVFNIGTVRPGEQDSFLIETELASEVDANDEIRFVADVAYNDNSRIRKIVEVIDESTFGEISSGGGAFTAAIADAFRGFFTNPLLWIILFILLIVFAVRYMFAARDKRTDTLV